MIEKDPSKAISMFWAAINAGDRVDSALKDMAVAMKQLDRSDEAIEAIKSFRHLCPDDSQESLDNILIELYKRSKRIEEEIELLQHKLKNTEEAIAFGGKNIKIVRSQGKKHEITFVKELSRILGNLAWAYLQKNDYQSAEKYYMKALSLELDKNKQCNLAICLMHMNRILEAKSLLQAVRASSVNETVDNLYSKSFEHAFQMLTELESKLMLHETKSPSGKIPWKQTVAGETMFDNVVFCTQPRYIQGSYNKEQRSKRWREEVHNKMEAHVVRNLNGELQSSPNEKSGMGLRDPAAILSPTCEGWRRRTWKLISQDRIRR
ncbi:protein POLLENLESS 3-like isoform X2 [Mangifera indica]|nr:protein POLLENLESS 3-like isoform X2 [Mangifera indica]